MSARPLIKDVLSLRGGGGALGAERGADAGRCVAGAGTAALCERGCVHGGVRRCEILGGGWGGRRGEDKKKSLEIGNFLLVDCAIGMVILKASDLYELR